MKIKRKVSKTIFTVLKDLNPSQIQEVLRFALFIRTRPDQAYFWTSQWQTKERMASHDKKLRRILGNGSPSDLINSLQP